jgi:choline dehydrogenase-like flavoprotein
MDLRTDAAMPGDGTVIVVGSGPPGAAAALRLIHAGVDVTLLEAGLGHRALGLTMRIRGVTVARLHRGLGTRTSDVVVSGDPDAIVYEDIAPGGLTNHWSCAVPRFSPDDFRDARRAGDRYTWPIGYDDLVPWYEWVEPLLHISGASADAPQMPAGSVRTVRSLPRGWQPVAEAAARYGHGLVPVPYVYGARTTLTLSGTVFNSFVRLLKPAQRAGRLTVHDGARVVQLEWSAARRRVEAVVFRDVRSGATRRIGCRAVVLAAGAINTAKILLQSTSGDFPAGLGNTHGVLGRYLHDHPLGKVGIHFGSPIPIHPAACLTRQPLDQAPPLYAAACLQWSGTGTLARSVVTGRPGYAFWSGFNIFGTMAPSADNCVALDTSRASDDGTPALDVRVRFPPQSAETLVGARDRLISLLEEARLRPRVGVWITEPAGGAVHFAGTCRMHASPEFGMLDGRSRLHAVPNVVVADSAAFTTGPEKNPVLTAMALAARGSQFLADDLRSGLL